MLHPDECSPSMLCGYWTQRTFKVNSDYTITARKKSYKTGIQGRRDSSVGRALAQPKSDNLSSFPGAHVNMEENSAKLSSDLHTSASPHLQIHKNKSKKLPRMVVHQKIPVLSGLFINNFWLFYRESLSFKPDGSARGGENLKNTSSDVRPESDAVQMDCVLCLCPQQPASEKCFIWMYGI